MIDETLPRPPELKNPAPRILTWSELCALPPPEWHVDQLFEKGGLVLAFGPSGHGKTFFALDLMLCCSYGLTWHGHAVSQGNAVYVCGEGLQGINRRIDAWRTFHGIEEPPAIGSSETAVPVGEPEIVEGFLARIKSSDLRPTLIVIDTLNANFGRGHENDTRDMTAFVDSIRRIRDVTGATVLVVHHTGHENQQRSRGSSALKAAVDTEIQIARSEVDEDLIGITVRKQRNGEIWTQPKGFRFESTGDSCVLVPTDDVPELGAKVQSGLGKNQTALLEAIVPHADHSYPNERDWPYIGQIEFAKVAGESGISNKRRSEVVAGLLKRRLLTAAVGGYLISPTVCR